jgi:hypothetical protein
MIFSLGFNLELSANKLKCKSVSVFKNGFLLSFILKYYRLLFNKYLRKHFLNIFKV